MADRDIDIVIQACVELADALDRAAKRADGLNVTLDRAATGIEKLDELYKELKINISAAIKGAECASPSGVTDGKAGRTTEEASGLRGQEEAKYQVRKEYSDKFIDLLGKEYREQETYNVLLKIAAAEREVVVMAAYKSMERQMLRLIEVGRFSVKEFGDVIIKQVKLELVGLAARAAVNAIYQTAVGFAHLAYGNGASASLAFTSAKTFGLVAGASLGAAAGVQEVLGNGADKHASGMGAAVAVNAKNISNREAVPMKLNPDGPARPAQNITISIYNPLSEQNWQKIVEDNIVPALNSAADRNISLTVRQA